MSRKVLWASHRVKGAYYYRDSAAYKEMAVEFAKGKVMEVVLQREPTNMHDSKAIKVLATDGYTLIGYVPKEDNHQLGLIMDNYGSKVTAVITPESNFKTNMLYMNILVDMDPYVAKPTQEVVSKYYVDGNMLSAGTIQLTTFAPKVKPKTDDFI